MANTSVDGLVSGLSTTDVINQLLQLEKQPQARLKTQQKALGTTTTAYQGLNTRYDAVLQAAKVLQDPATWTAPTGTTSDSTRVRVSAGAGALTGELRVTVDRLAVAHAVVSERPVNGLDTVVATGPVSFTVGGTGTGPIDVGDGSLRSVVAAINEAGVGVRAAAVQVSPGQYRLQLTATATGTAGAFSVDAGSLDGLADPGETVPDAAAFDVLATGTDARLLMGGPTGYAVTSSTNTFTDLLPGVTVTALTADAGTTVTVGVTTDVDGLKSKVDKLVAAVNGALGYVKDNSRFDQSTGTKGPLLGNGLARQVEQRLYGALGLDLPGSSLADVGLKLGANGLELDGDRFRAALQADPAKVAEAFTGAASATAGDGLATKLVAVGTEAAAPSTGLVSQALTALEQRSDAYTRQIEAWDVRLATRETTLRRQFAAMESALGALKNQSSWLAGQISSLPSWT